ncbi:MAG: (2Fe-2S)-binding protein [candidate division Zixibacteria bacterium SM23_81]|nr:MAG: (2Fe-2S)-binding protein [candidate division Zixibacteria bacterium SM23_81]
MTAESKNQAIQLVVNGKTHRAVVAPQATLLELIRDHLGLTGTKEGCGKGQCGACTVLLDGKPVNSCLMLAVQAQGHQVVTIEGAEHEKELDPIQQAFIDEGAVQCGFCTPGLILSARALLDQHPHPDEDHIKEAISGHLCRCTGYSAIIRAIRRAASGGKS